MIFIPTAHTQKYLRNNSVGDTRPGSAPDTSQISVNISVPLQLLSAHPLALAKCHIRLRLKKAYAVRHCTAAPTLPTRGEEQVQQCRCPELMA